MSVLIEAGRARRRRRRTAAARARLPCRAGSVRCGGAATRGLRRRRTPSSGSGVPRRRRGRTAGTRSCARPGAPCGSSLWNCASRALNGARRPRRCRPSSDRKSPAPSLTPQRSVRRRFWRNRTRPHGHMRILNVPCPAPPPYLPDPSHAPPSEHRAARRRHCFVCCRTSGTACVCFARSRHSRPLPCSCSRWASAPTPPSSRWSTR